MTINAFQALLLIVLLAAVMARNFIELGGGATTKSQNKIIGILSGLTTGALIGGYVAQRFF